jgi:hypothetical protein
VRCGGERAGWAGCSPWLALLAWAVCACCVVLCVACWCDVMCCDVCCVVLYTRDVSKPHKQCCVVFSLSLFIYSLFDRTVLVLSI